MEKQAPGASTATRRFGGGTWIPLILGLGVLLAAFSLPLLLSYSEPAFLDWHNEHCFVDQRAA